MYKRQIHYRADLAVGAMERGIAKVRINPGNIGSVREVRRVADCAKMHHVPIRIGVNSGSVEKEILAQEGGVTARGMLRSALGHARLLEEAGFHDIVLSLKASSVPLTVEDVYKRQQFWPSKLLPEMVWPPCATLWVARCV